MSFSFKKLLKVLDASEQVLELAKENGVNKSDINKLSRAVTAAKAVADAVGAKKRTSKK